MYWIGKRNRKGRVLNITIQAWHQMLMRGTKEQKMYRHPFTLLKINVTDDTNKSLVETDVVNCYGLDFLRANNLREHFFLSKVQLRK
ncbi:MAG: hypothetical protein PUP91_24365 [Rhizonema sp. PD37]|nr:hypothetical protein [Rhizonema sp. PD37]